MTTSELLHDAAEWHLLGLLFECPGADWRRRVEAIAREVHDDGLRAAVAAIDDTATEGQFHSVFGPGGPAPPREATYRDTLELGSLLSELAVYYDAFGFMPRIEEPPDHVAVEIGFVAYLKFKEGYARATGREEDAEVAARAAAAFIADHLAMMASPLADVLRHSHLEYLACASQILAARVGPAPRSTMLPMLQPSDEDDGGGAFECAGS
jgi:nitrate reductase assembly molybdenum cofactor insertion protein NarJ